MADDPPRQLGAFRLFDSAWSLASQLSARHDESYVVVRTGDVDAPYGVEEDHGQEEVLARLPGDPEEVLPTARRRRRRLVPFPFSASVANDQ